jgi:hypothetical protein
MEKDTGSLAEMVEESLKLSRENNQLLKAIRRDALIGGVIKVLIWGVLIGGSLYFSLHYLEPLLAPMQALQGQGGTDGMKVLLELYNGNLPSF